MSSRALHVAPLAALVLLALCACVTTQESYSRYRIPLADNDAGPGVAALCAKSCEGAYGKKPRTLVKCLRECPGVEKTASARCINGPPDVPPEALCYTHVRRKQVASRFTNEVAAGIGRGLAEGLGQAIGGAVSSATSSSSSSSSGGSSRKPASPSRGHKPASPSRK